MALAKGTYNIIATGKNGQHVYLGRSSEEDKSVLPKPIIVLPEEVRVREWQIEDLPNGTYHLKSVGSPAAAFGDNVFVVLMPQHDDSLAWVLTPVPESGADVFIIENAERTDRWVLQDDAPHSQVSLEPIWAVSSKQQANALFRIVPDHGSI